MGGSDPQLIVSFRFLLHECVGMINPPPILMCATQSHEQCVAATRKRIYLFTILRLSQ